VVGAVAASEPVGVVRIASGAGAIGAAWLAATADVVSSTIAAPAAGEADAAGATADGSGGGRTTGSDFATCGFGAGIGWIETYSPSQIIRFGAYHHGVKKPRNCLTVSDFPGRMS
jgi:hypothetical protein